MLCQTRSFLTILGKALVLMVKVAELEKIDSVKYDLWHEFYPMS